MGIIRLAPGGTIGGKWLLRRRIGRGGMGEVWLAVHKSLEQEVALKVLDQDAFPVDLLEEARSRFHLEAQLAADLSRRTRHIARVVDHGNDEGIDYLVMELLNGDSLEDLLQRNGKMEPGRVVEVVRQASRGLAVAHGDQVTHRDLKPSNIFVSTDDDGTMLVKLLDFGIAKARARPSRGSDTAPPSTHRTRAGVLLGTAAYMSPEQARGLEIDTRADLWALAALTYELLTGELPFNGTSDVDLLMNICTGAPTPVTTLVPSIPKGIDAVFQRAFAREIDGRFPDARAFADALTQALDLPLPLVTPAHGANSITIANYVATPSAMHAFEEPRPESHRALWLALAGALALVLVAVVFLVSRGKPPAAAAAPGAEPFAPAVVVAPSVAPVAAKSMESAAPSASVSKPVVSKQSKTKVPGKVAPSATTTAKKVDQGEIF